MGTSDRLAALEREAASLDSVALSPIQLAELALILNGAFQPLQGYMAEADYDSVLRALRLANGRCFPLPVALDLDMTTARTMETGKRIALRDGEGVAFAVLTVENVWRKDTARESQILGVDDDTDRRGSYYVGGKVEGIRLPAHPFFAQLRPTPAALQQRIQERGFNRVLGVESAGAIHRHEHEIVTAAAAELDAAILLNPAIGTPDPDNQAQVVMIKCLLAVLPYFPPRTTLLALLDYPARKAGLREFLMQAILRKRCGATHFIMRDITQRMIDSDARLQSCLGEIEMEAVAWPERSLSSTGRGIAGAPRAERTDKQFDPVQLVENLRRGEDLPEGYTFPQVATVLEAHYRPLKRSGFTLFFTGLSGSGKSTIAKIVQARVAERDPRPVTLLDGDIVRRKFSKGLGFSKQDRDTNVRRIGAAAADITKGGGIAICCPIAPYAETRKAVRGMIEPHGAMIEIHVATPIDVCERRDPKGLYKKAREGRIQNFTGVDDPYEQPVSPDVRIDASEGSPDCAANLVIAYMEENNLISKTPD